MKTKSEWYIQDASTIHAAAQLSRCSPFKSIWKSITKHTDTERDKWRDREGARERWRVEEGESNRQCNVEKFEFCLRITVLRLRLRLQLQLHSNSKLEFWHMLNDSCNYFSHHLHNINLRYFVRLNLTFACHRRISSINFKTNFYRALVLLSVQVTVIVRVVLTLLTYVNSGL